MIKFLLGLLLIPAFLMGCGQSNNSNTNIQEGKSGGNIIVHVADGDPTSRPLYTWEDLNNDMTAMKIAVARTSDLKDVWSIQSTTLSDTIQSPWQQGTTGGSVSETVSTERDLQTNIEYRVTITKADGITSGYRNFTIMP
ncbi:MAG TPA: hypothetical protein VMN77_00985 [Nitrospiria bacterium]|jgi:hypothetical protein|nr:hypothetical protein [Nitrospiria bacterium]